MMPIIRKSRSISFIIISWVMHANAFAVDNSIDAEKMQAGYQAFQAICSTCHTQDSVSGNRVAPPIAKVKLHYLSDTNNFAEFNDAVIKFVSEPTKDIKMKGAFQKFGAMPKLSLDEAMISDIAYYIYHTPLERSDYNKATADAQLQKYAQSTLHPLNSDDDYKKHGLMLAMQTKSALGAQLKKAIVENGTEGAVEFCNDQAIPITTSMSEQLNASIKRVSDKPRNPDNLANTQELEIINSLKLAMASGQQPTPQVMQQDINMVGYYPIVTNGMCLGCHGVPDKQIDAKTLSMIKGLYPQDKAIGYDANELRGLFVVEMKNKSN